MTKHKKSKSEKKNDNFDFSAEDLMNDALKRIEKINGKKSSYSGISTFDEVLTKKSSNVIKPLTDHLQTDDITNTETKTQISEEEPVTSKRDYVDFKVDKEIFSLEKRVAEIISEGKTSILKWGISIVVGAIFASWAVMSATHQLSIQQFNDFITKKFDTALSETNEKLNYLTKEQNYIKTIIKDLKNGKHQ